MYIREYWPTFQSETKNQPTNVKGATHTQKETTGKNGWGGEGGTRAAGCAIHPAKHITISLYYISRKKRIEKRGGHIKQYAAAQQQHSHLLNYFPFELDF